MPAGVSAYVPLANITLGASASSVTFSGINQGYRDLIIIMNAKASTTTGFYMRLNADSGLNYNFIFMYGSGTAYSAGVRGDQNYGTLGWNTEATTTDPFMATISLIDYTATNKHKTALIRSNSASRNVEAVTLRYASLSAVTSAAIYPNTGTFSAGSTFALYGVSA